MQQNEQLIREAYSAFNARDIGRATRLMHTAVQWPNGWEGGYVNGREEVSAYWTRQWKELDPTVEPVAFRETPGGQIEVTVHQVVKDLNGRLLADLMLKHTYALEDGMIKSMSIEKP